MEEPNRKETIIKEQYGKMKEEEGAAFEQQQVTDACPNPQLNWDWGLNIF